MKRCTANTFEKGKNIRVHTFYECSSPCSEFQLHSFSGRANTSLSASTKPFAATEGLVWFCFLCSNCPCTSCCVFVRAKRPFNEMNSGCFFLRKHVSDPCHGKWRSFEKYTSGLFFAASLRYACTESCWRLEVLREREDLDLVMSQRAQEESPTQTATKWSWKVLPQYPSQAGPAEHLIAGNALVHKARLSCLL